MTHENRRFSPLLAAALLALACSSGGSPSVENPVAFDNPLIKSDSADPTAAPADGTSWLHTADPAAMVWGGRVYVYTGHDEAPAETYTWSAMHDWYAFSSSDMVHWTNHGVVMKERDVFNWCFDKPGEGYAYAGQVVERDDPDGKPRFYYYAPVREASTGRMAIGVAVSDSPTGPFRDPRGNPLIADRDTPQASNEDIDSTVLVDDDGQAYLYWGQNSFYWVKLSEDMVHLEGEVTTTYPESGLIATDDKSGVTVHQVALPGSFESTWLHKHDGLYYLSYAAGYPERIVYAMSTSPEGPWDYQGVVLDVPRWGNTTHQSIFDFNGASWVFYHDASLADGFTQRRAICLDRLYYDVDGTIQQVVMTDTDQQGIRMHAIGYPNHWFTLQRDATVRGHESGGASLRYDKSQWKVVQGLADAGSEYVSFESVHLPGQYMVDSGVYAAGAGDADRHQVVVAAPPSDATAAELFRKAATFKRVPGLADGSWTSFRSYTDLTRFLRHYSYWLYVEPLGNGELEDGTMQPVDQ